MSWGTSGTAAAAAGGRACGVTVMACGEGIAGMGAADECAGAGVGKPCRMVPGGAGAAAAVGPVACGGGCGGLGGRLEGGAPDMSAGWSGSIGGGNVGVGCVARPALSQLDIPLVIVGRGLADSVPQKSDPRSTV